MHIVCIGTLLSHLAQPGNGAIYLCFNPHVVYGNRTLLQVFLRQSDSSGESARGGGVNPACFPI